MIIMNQIIFDKYFKPILSNIIPNDIIKYIIHNYLNKNGNLMFYHKIGNLWNVIYRKALKLKINIKKWTPVREGVFTNKYYCIDYHQGIIAYNFIRRKIIVIHKSKHSIFSMCLSDTILFYGSHDSSCLKIHKYDLILQKIIKVHYISIYYSHLGYTIPTLARGASLLIYYYKSNLQIYDIVTEKKYVANTGSFKMNIFYNEENIYYLDDENLVEYNYITQKNKKYSVQFPVAANITNCNGFFINDGIVYCEFFVGKIGFIISYAFPTFKYIDTINFPNIRRLYIKNNMIAIIRSKSVELYNIKKIDKDKL